MILPYTTQRALALLGFFVAAAMLVVGAVLTLVNAPGTFLFGCLGYFGMKTFAYLLSH